MLSILLWSTYKSKASFSLLGMDRILLLIYDARLTECDDQDSVLHSPLRDPLHDQHLQASGQDHPQGLQGLVWQTRLLQISFQDNGQRIRHGKGGGENNSGVTTQIYLLQCQALTMHNSTFYWHGPFCFRLPRMTRFFRASRGRLLCGLRKNENVRNGVLPVLSAALKICDNWELY